MRALLLVALLVACGKSERDEYLRKSKEVEARLSLKRIAREAQELVVEGQKLPAVTVPPTPAAACCSNPDKKCPASAADWAKSPWQELRFAPDAPTYFQYSYTGDGTKFTATATGDVNCDGTKATFSITGTVGPGGLTVDDSQIKVPEKK